MNVLASARRGIALFAALGLTAIVGLLVGGVVMSSMLAQRAATASHVDARLDAAADFALGWVIEQQRVRGLADLPLGQPAVFANVPAGGDGLSATVSATRLPDDVLWLVGEATTGAAWAGRRRVNLVARWPRIGMRPPAGIVSRGDVRVGAGVVLAADTTGDVECRATGSSPQVITPLGARVASPDSLRITTDSTAADSATYYLTAAQRAVLDSLPGVVRVRGDTTVSGGRLDGLVLIDGALVITGSVTVTGVIVARGSIEVRGGSLFVTGAVMSFAAPNGGYAIEVGAGSIRHSPCEIARALRRIVPLRPVRGRSWSELF